METISVIFKPLGSFLGTTYYHQTLVYKDSFGQSFFMSAAPTLEPQIGSMSQALSMMSKASVAVQTGSGSPFGELLYETQMFNPQSSQAIGITIDAQGNAYASQVVASGESLETQWLKILGAASEIEGANVQYSPLTQNSNSVASTALTAAGIQLPTNVGFSGDFWCPAAGVIIDTSETAPQTNLTVGVVPGEGDDATLTIVEGDDDHTFVIHESGDEVHAHSENEDETVTRDEHYYDAGVIAHYWHNADDTWGEYHDYGDGTTDTYIYEPGGLFISTAWDHGEGGHGEITYHSVNGDYFDNQYYHKEWVGADGTSFEIEDRNLDGSESGSFQFADGTYGSYWFDGNETYHSEWYDEGGIYFSISNDLENGARNTSYVFEDGTHGYDDFDFNGVGHHEWYGGDGIAYTVRDVFSDGTEEFHEQYVTAENFTYTAVRLDQADDSYLEEWESSNGNHGSTMFDDSADRLSSSVFFADGSWSMSAWTYYSNGTQYDWAQSDGSHGSEFFPTSG
jgi:hypothetical protein